MTRNQQKMSSLTIKEKLLYISLALTIFLVIFLYANEFRYFDSTLHVGGLILWSLMFGLIVGALAAFFYCKNRISNLTEKVKIYVFFIVVALFFMPLLASLSNRLISFQPVKSTEVELAKETANFSSRYGLLKGEEPVPNHYYLFFYKDGELYRIETKAPRYTGKKRGEKIRLPIKKGLWGYEVVVGV